MSFVRSSLVPGRHPLAVTLASVFLVSSLPLSFSASNEKAWEPMAPMPDSRFEPASAVIDSRLYVFGGFLPGGQASTRVDVFDPARNSWTRLTDLPQPLTHVNAAVDGKSIWFAGGFQGDHPGRAVDNVWVYDVATDGYAPGPPLPEPRAGGGLAVLGKSLHYFGGLRSDRDTDAPSHWVLARNRRSGWKDATPITAPRNQFGVAVLDGRIYAVGGQLNHDRNGKIAPNDRTLVQAYDPGLDQWIVVASLPVRLSHFEGSIVAYQGRVLTVGGRNMRGESDSVLAYDPKTDRWSNLSVLPLALIGPAAGIIEGRLIVTGGATRGYVARKETWGYKIGKLFR